MKRGEAASTGKRLLGESEFKNGKLDLPSPLAQPPKCPECTSHKVWRDGIRQTRHGNVQRYICRECGYRFSENTHKGCSDNFECSENDQKVHRLILKTPEPYLYNCRVSDRRQGGAKNLVEVETRQKQAAGATRLSKADIKGKIIEYSFWLLKQGYAKSTIKGRTKLLKRLLKLGASLYDFESVKEVIAKQEWSLGRKANAVDAYTSFLQMHGMTWNPPVYKKIRKIPFIPTETEIDQLIAGCNRRMSTFLQLLKETGMRCGEACQLKWTDADLVNNSVRVTPEKGSNARILKISNKLVDMLNGLPKHSRRLFGANSDAMRKSYQLQRKRITAKLRNSRLRQITFHTFRHWKATMEYHKTRDILHVMQMLGHRNIQNTLIYTQLVDFKDDEYVARVASSEKQVCQLIEAGFQYVCDYDRNKVFRKRK